MFVGQKRQTAPSGMSSNVKCYAITETRQKMNTEHWVDLYKKYELPTHKIKLIEKTTGQSSITRIGGNPWWPEGTERPRCEDGHNMSFIAQINLSDLPQNESNILGLVSFHYCIQCQYEGNMAFGWNHEENKNYDIRVFSDLNIQVDGKPQAGEPILPEQVADFEKVLEIPDVNDLPLDVSEIVPDEFFDFTPPDYDQFSFIPSDIVWPNLKHVHGTKIGGHPTWVQDPEWPPGTMDGRMKFVAQLDGLVGEIASWADGAAFLFIDKDEKGKLIAEMGLQHG
jgi:uncharacterized protein YwqG